ncbi:class I SAM-dependent methyltransferase [Cognatilysobacter lacus]|nr:class I SAM-dependent methyltransferase [Lysobacter lacus]
MLAGVQGGAVLDVGCADRWIENELPGHCAYVGLDHPAIGGATYGARPTIFGDATRLPLRDGVFDYVVALEVVEHLPDPYAALQEMARVIKPGGGLILSMPFMYPVHDDPHDYQRFTEHGLARALAMVGFTEVQITGSPHALRTAALATCLALAGSAVEALRKGGPALLVVPVVAIAVPVVNVTAWAASRVFPEWRAMPAGYLVRAAKA